MSKKLLVIVFIVGAMFGTGCKSVVLVKAPPGQVKKTTGTNSAKASAPGQVKKTTGATSAKEYAPGQQKKKNGSKSAKENAPGQKNKDH